MQPNGDYEELDFTNPDIHVLVGVVIRTRAEISELRTMATEQGLLLRRIAKSLGIDSQESSVPPIRQELDSLHEIDKQITGKVANLEQDQKVIKVTVVEGLPKIVKVLGAIAAAVLGLTSLIYQIWTASR